MQLMSTTQSLLVGRATPVTCASCLIFNVRQKLFQAASDRNQPCRNATTGSPESTAEASGCHFCIRAATCEDVQRLATIEQLCSEHSAGWRAAEIQVELSKEFSCILVAADNCTQAAVGYIVGWLISGELQVLELAVDPAQQSQGIGTALLGALLQQCGCNKDVEAVLEVKEGNDKALRLYMNHGFRHVGYRRKYYADGSAALLLARPPG